jgi:hypothetical protein
MLKSLVRNRTTEKDVRAWLDQNGYYGTSATIEGLELHAVQRPGWLQIFSFQARVKSRDGSDQPWSDMFGVVKDDERKRGDQKTQVELFPTAGQQTDRLEQWSQGLISKSNSKDKGSPLVLTIAGVVCVAIALSIINLLT